MTNLSGLAVADRVIADPVIATTRDWLERVVIGLGLRPFANVAARMLG